MTDLVELFGDKLPRWTLAFGVYTFGGLMAASALVGPLNLGPYGDWGFKQSIFQLIFRLEEKGKVVVTKPKDELEWRQKEYVVKLTQNFSKDLQGPVSIVEKCFPNFLTQPTEIKNNVISTADSKKILTDVKLEELRQ